MQQYGTSKSQFDFVFESRTEDLLPCLIFTSIMFHIPFRYLKDSLRELQFSQRVQMVLGALLSVCGQGLRDQFTKQEALELTLSQIADQLKPAKDSTRIVRHVLSAAAQVKTQYLQI